ncbi:MAG: hypothetical protein RLO50_00460 [Azospirillaceae bacterium]
MPSTIGQAGAPPQPVSASRLAIDRLDMRQRRTGARSAAIPKRRPGASFACAE